jgi:hypothetical protein
MGIVHGAWGDAKTQRGKYEVKTYFVKNILKSEDRSPMNERSLEG